VGGSLAHASNYETGRYHLLVQALPVARLDGKFCGEDVGQLGAIAIAPAGDLYKASSCDHSRTVSKVGN